VQGTVTERLRSHEEILNQLLEAVRKELQHILVEADNAEQQARTQMDNMMAELNEHTEKSFAQVLSDTEELLKIQRNSLNEIVTKHGNAAEAVGQRIETEMRTLASGLRSSVSSQADSAIEATEHKFETTLAELEEALERRRETLGHESDEVISGIAEMFEEASSEISRQLETITQEITQTVDATANTLSEQCKTIDSRLTTEFRVLGDGLLSTVSDLESNLKRVTDDLMEYVNTEVNGINEKLNTLVVESESEITTHLDASKVATDKSGEQLLQTLTETAEEFKSKSVETVSSSLKSLQSETISFRKDVETLVDSLCNELGSLSDSLVSEINGLTQGAMKSDLVGNTNAFFERAFPSSVSVKGEGTEVAKILRVGWDRLVNSGYPGAKKTWTVVTHKAVLSHIQDMVQRAKSKVTLVLPSYDEVPEDMIARSKSAIGIEIVVSEDPRIMEKAKALIGKGNVRIRTRPERDVYACIRDSEEMLLAPASAKKEEIVGVVTEDEGFVRFIMGTIGPIFQSKARLLRQEDT
ncbi:MAG: TrmB family transcriptional regulator sugar-binding domain-containing protein, partial [Candidatus Thorarchaeota archaeon]